MKKFDSKRKGFTLIELLIVIVVIGILSAMMMLSSTEAVTSAKASNIVSNIRNLKTAALAYYADHLDTLAETTVTNQEKLKIMDGVVAYLGNNSDMAVDTNKQKLTADGVDYCVCAVAAGKASDVSWYIEANITDSKVQEKLAGRAKSVGLTYTAAPMTTGTSGNVYVKGKPYLYALIR